MLSKIVVFVRTHTNSELQSGISVEEFPQAHAMNNNRGELIIWKLRKEDKGKDKLCEECTIAVFKEWIYWKEIE